MHWVKHCRNGRDAKKKSFKEKTAAAKAGHGPARSTRSQTASQSDAVSASSTKTVARVLKTLPHLPQSLKYRRAV